jgi:hypothetical protein
LGFEQSLKHPVRMMINAKNEDKARAFMSVKFVDMRFEI